MPTTLDDLCKMDNLFGVSRVFNGVAVLSFDRFGKKPALRFAEMVENHYQTEGNPLDIYEQALERGRSLFVMVFKHGIVQAGCILTNCPKTHPITGVKLPCIELNNLFVSPAHRRKGLARKVVNTVMENIEAIAALLGYNEPIRVIFESEEAAWDFWKPMVAELITNGWYSGKESLYGFTETDVVSPRHIATTVAIPGEWEVGANVIQVASHEVWAYFWPEEGYEFGAGVDWFHPQRDGVEISHVKIAFGLNPVPVPPVSPMFHSFNVRVELVK